MANEIGNSVLVRTWANNGSVVTPSNAKIDEGWLFGELPPAEWMNYIHNILGQKVNHALSRGAADWVGTTEYLAGAVVNHSGNIWLSLATNIDSAPSGSNANWTQIPRFGGAASFTTLSASTSVTTPLVTNAGTVALSATGANVITALTNGSERMRITSAGNVGIGTSSPWARLAIPFNAGLSFGDASFPFTISRASVGELVTTIADGYDAGTAEIRFVMRSGSANENTALSIKGTGNVGIGTSSPARALHVSDVMRLQPRATAPGSPAKGDIYFDSSDDKLKCYDGTAWQNLF